MSAENLVLPPLAPVERQPLSDAGAARLWAMDVGPMHVSEAYVRRWLGTASPFAAYGHAALLFAGDDAGMLVSVNPRVAGEPFVAFALLRIRPDLPETDRAAATAALFEEARRFGREHGAVAIRGPIAFSTWHPYRVLAEDLAPSAPAFPGEGVEAPAHHRYYRAAGLAVTDRYMTTAVPDDAEFWARHLAAESVVAARRRDGGGAAIRPLGAAEGRAHLGDFHAMIGETFSRNAHFAPIDAPEFAELLLGEAPPGIVPLHLGAFAPDGRLVGVCAGFVWGDRGVLKTLAVRPEVQGGRTAMALTFAFHRHLHAQGVNTALHALMKSDNRSASMSAKYAQPVRHYVLYGAPLA
ncbi:MAG: GNAT family N-acetyltransferase [Candidatus Sericytochromatia bacterium]